MNLKSIKIWIILLMSGIIGLQGCGDKSDKKEEDVLLEPSESPKIETEHLNEILGQIPSPIEISLLLTEAGSEFDPAITNTVENASTYNSSFKKAINLGVYGTDLGYTNIYHQHQEGIRFVDVIRDLSNDLDIGHFFDFQLIKRLATRGDNLDSLLMVTTQDYNAINEHLQEQNRSNLSVLLLAGGWIEAMHIAFKVAEKAEDKTAFKEKVGEQKIVLNNIAILLDAYKGTSPQIQSLYENIVELKSAFEPVEIQYTYQESSSEVVDGVLVIEDNSSSSVSISDMDYANIKSSIDNIRTDIIN